MPAAATVVATPGASTLIDALDSLEEGFAIFDADDRLVLVNRRCRELFADVAHHLQPGVRFEDLIRAVVAAGGVLDAVGREDAWIAERLQRRRELRGVDAMRRPGGRTMRIHESPTRDGGTVLVYRDFTELRRHEDELASAQRAVGRSERLAALGELIAGVSHEMQNALNLMSNFAEVSGRLVDELREGLAAGGQPVPGETVERLDLLADNLAAIRRHGERADRTVRAMLQSARSDDTGVDTDINRLVDDALALAPYALPAGQQALPLSIRRDFDAQAGHAVVHAQEIGRVLLNLFANAIHAMRMRRVGGEPGYQAVLDVATRGHADRVVVEVRDNGIGIAPGDLERIFTRFFTTKPVGEGTGLGLALSRDIVARHGGRLWARSEPCVETVLTLELPRRASHGEPA